MKKLLTLLTLAICLSAGCKPNSKQPIEQTQEYADTINISIKAATSSINQATAYMNIHNKCDSFKNAIMENVLDYQNTGIDKYRLRGLRNVDSLKKYDKILSKILKSK